MRRVVGDGVDLYEIVVDDEGESMAGRAPPAYLSGRTARLLSFGDPAEARRFVQRVADDYSEKLALRQVLAHVSGRDDVYRVHEDELVVTLADLLVAGTLTVNQLEKGS